MKKKTILGILLLLSLVITVTVTAAAPAFANNPTASNAQHGTIATVKLQLPPPEAH